MLISLVSLKEQAKKKLKENKKFFARLKLKNKNHDPLIHRIHEEVFACTDCLKCANCCKTTGPMFTQKDIERLASRLKMKPGDFTEKYLRVDEDKDYVLKTVPCPFLAADNYCGVYEDRPKACREYPHTDREKQSQLYNLTLKNTEICPAVFEIIEKLKKELS